MYFRDSDQTNVFLSYAITLIRPNAQRCLFAMRISSRNDTTYFFFSTIPKSCPHLIFYSEMCNFFKINCIFILRSIRQFSWQPPSHFCPVARLLLPIIYLFIYSSLILCFFNTFPYVLNKQDTHLYITIYMRKPHIDESIIDPCNPVCDVHESRMAMTTMSSAISSSSSSMLLSVSLDIAPIWWKLIFCNTLMLFRSVPFHSIPFRDIARCSRWFIRWFAQHGSLGAYTRVVSLLLL